MRSGGGDRQLTAADAGLLQGVQVLVVDDDDDARDPLHTVLEYWGATVVSAESARGALATLGNMPASA